MSYKPFTTEYTYQIIDDIKEYLEETNKDQATLDTLDLSHLIGEIERLNNIIDELEKYIKKRCWKDEYNVDTIYTSNLLNKLQELKGEDKNDKS